LKSTERLGVIGDPIGHSLSPAIQRAALDDAGLTWTYDAHRVAVDELVEWLASVGRSMRGFNATIPHKVALLGQMDELDPAATSIGAVNTAAHHGTGLRGYNTDPTGFLAALATLPLDARATRVLVFGAGGAARAVVYALRPVASEIVVASRDARRAAMLSPDAALALDDPALRAAIREADLLVNATPMGMSHLPDATPLPVGTELQPETAVMDLVYGRDTPLLATARDVGCRCADGTEMLVQQGAESFRLWTGQEPNVEVMREALKRAADNACTGSTSVAS
jgi:shikimate dehydrogenase